MLRSEQNGIVIIALQELFFKNSIEELSFSFLASGHSQNEDGNVHSVIVEAWKYIICTQAQW